MSIRRFTRGQLFSHTALKWLGTEREIEWLERSFQKLLLNFTWWVNRKGPLRNERI